MATVETLAQQEERGEEGEEQEEEQEKVAGENEEGKVVAVKRSESDGATLEYLSYRDGVGSKSEGSQSKSMNSIVWCLPDPSASSSGELKDSSVNGTMEVKLSEPLDLPDDFKEMLRSQFVRYGDKIKLCTRSHYALRTGREGDFGNDGNGYVGLYEKPDGTIRVAIPPIGPNSPGKFSESVFDILPAGDGRKRQRGDFVKYGDVVVLVDAHGLVWNSKSGGFFEGYLGPRGRGIAGEMFVSFKKNGREGKQMLHGDPGVFIDVVESHRHRTSYNYRLSNYKTATSKCEGGYICSDGHGSPIAFSIHPQTGVPSLAYGRHGGDPSLLNRPLADLILATPEIESVRVLSSASSSPDTAILDPKLNSVFKIFNVAQDDDIVFTLYNGSKAMAKVRSLLQRRESRLVLSAPNLGFTRAAKYVREGEAKRTANDANLVALQIMCERGVPPSPKPDHRQTRDSRFGHLGILLSFDKLAVLYLLVAFGLPYVLWNAVVYLHLHADLLLRHVSQTLGASAATAASSVISWITLHYDTSTLQPCGISEASSVSSVMLAMFFCWFSGFATPRFITNQATKQEGGGKEKQRETMQLLMTISLNTQCFALPRADSRLGSDEDAEMAQAEVELEPLRSPWFLAGTDEDGKPLHEEFERFLIGEKGDMASAMKRWKDTINWREDLGVDTILDQPHLNFDIIKRYYPHVFCGMTKDNHQLYIERNVQVNLKMLKENGLTLEDLLWHYVYTAEYQCRVLHEQTGCKDGKSTTILDVEGLKIRDFVGEVMQYVKRATHIAQARYPERSFRIYILNVPNWFNVIFRVVKPLLDEVTLDKIKIYRHGFEHDLLEHIDAQTLPNKYGGQYQGGDYETEQELEFRKFVMQRIEKAGLQMKPVY